MKKQPFNWVYSILFYLQVYMIWWWCSYIHLRDKYLSFFLFVKAFFIKSNMQPQTRFTRNKENKFELRCEGDVTRAKKIEKESRRVVKGKRKKVSGVEEGGRFQSGYIGIYITFLASIFESIVCRAGGYNRTQLYFIIDGIGDACESSSR